MAISIYISDNAGSIKNKETAMEMINKVKTKTGHLICESRFTRNMSIEGLLDFLLENSYIEQEFIDYVAEEYGEPWVEGYPIDGANLIKAISEWSQIDAEEVKDYFDYIFALLAVENSTIREALHKMFKDMFGNNYIYINPIDKKYRSFSFQRDPKKPAALNLRKEALDSITESTEVILALTDDEMIKEQIQNIKDRVLGETHSIEVSE